MNLREFHSDWLRLTLDMRLFLRTPLVLDLLKDACYSPWPELTETRNQLT